VSATVDIRPGTVLGPYTLVRAIGEGASATVYAARDAAQREVAVKVRRTGTVRARGLESEMDRRFLREFESMRLLRVRGVVRVHEAGVDGDILWYSMDLVDGRPFHEVFTGPLAGRVERARKLGAELLRILATLHEAGFVHRDIKPTNVLVDADDHVSVLDFGIGRYFGDHDTLSHTGEVLGTVPYMAPEQVSGLPCDAQIDVFAAGLCLWEALAGKRVRPASAVGWIPRICMERPTPLCTLAPEVPRSLSAVVDSLLRVDPTQRITARQAATELAASVADADCHEWPEPPFVDPDGWTCLEGVLGGGSEHPPVWVLEGPAGAGKRRLAEQVQRTGLLQGVWTLHLRCRVDRVGSPFVELLEHLSRLLEDSVLARIVGSSGSALRQTWPHLVLPKAGEVSDKGLTEALTDVVADLARVRPVALVLHELEQQDPITARVLLALAARRPKDLGLLLIQDPRWATAESRELVEQLTRDHGAGRLVIGPVSAAVASRAARSLAPRSTVAVERPATFLAAVAAGWAALARWRGERFEAPSAALTCLVAGPRSVPIAVFDALVGAPGERAGARRGEDGVSADGASVRAMLTAQLTDRAGAAARLGTALERTLGNRAEISPDLAQVWLLAGDPARAWAPAVRAAVYEEQFERYVAAREWLLVLDTLPPGSRRDLHDDFELAWVHARVALHTDADDAGERMFLLVERLVRTEDQESRVRLLRAEFDLRAGQVRSALVTALRIGAGAGIPPQVQLQALLVAFRCRVVGRQLPEAERELERAESLLADHPNPVMQVRISNARAEVALLQEDLLWCRALCQKNIRVASQTRHLHALAEASFRLGSVLRMLGRRREAEHQIRTAADAALATGDLRIRADAGLALAGLLAERGEALPARVLLDDTIRRIRVLSLDHLLGSALRIALQIATLTGNATDGNVALASLQESPRTDAETAADLVQWWRTAGDLDRALAVPAPAGSTRGYGYVRWQVEQARSRMVAGDNAGASALAEQVAERSAELGFSELEIYGRLLLGVTSAVDDATWGSLQERAAGSMWCDVYLGALEMDARRLATTAPSQAEGRWRSLLVRARELGHRPGVEEATGWLGTG
jgi:serine/threonine protein kinase